MFRIVEDAMPPIPDGCSEPLVDFLEQCFNKDPSLRPSAELLCEHEWLKKHWGAHKVRAVVPFRSSFPVLPCPLPTAAGRFGGVGRSPLLIMRFSQDLRPQDSIPFLRRVSADLHKNEAVRHLAALDIVDPPLPERPRLEEIMSGSPRRPSTELPTPAISVPADNGDVTITK